MTAPRIPAGFDFTDPDLYARRVPNEELAELRRAAPIWWNPQPDSGFDDGGLGGVLRLQIGGATELTTKQRLQMSRHGAQIGSRGLRYSSNLVVEPPNGCIEDICHQPRIMQLVLRAQPSDRPNPFHP